MSPILFTSILFIRLALISLELLFKPALNKEITINILFFYCIPVLIYLQQNVWVKTKAVVTKVYNVNNNVCMKMVSNAIPSYSKFYH